MKPLSLLFLLVLLPAVAFCQTIVSPSVEYSDDPSTTIEKIEITPKYTAVHFKHTTTVKGGWLELNKSIYLQDADGEDRYNYLRSEGVKLRPLKDTATADNQVFNFTVYFEKIKPGTKSINVIERATSIMNRMSGTNYFNFYNVSLEKSDTAAFPSHLTRVRSQADTTSVSPFGNSAFSMGSMMNNLYTTLFDAQIKFYSDKSKVEAVAKINKSYYDALIKAGFNADQAFKILVSKPLVSTDMGGK